MNVTLSRIAPKPLRLDWFQNGSKAARIDCTGFSCTVKATNLPYVPAIITVNAAQGCFDLMPPDEAHLALVNIKTTYWLAIVLRDGAGAAIEGFELAVNFA